MTAHNGRAAGLQFTSAGKGLPVGGQQTAGVTSTGGWKWGFLHFDPQPCGNAFTAKRPLPTIAKTLSCLDSMELEAVPGQTEPPEGFGGTEQGASSTSTRTVVCALWRLAYSYPESSNSHEDGSHKES